MQNRDETIAELSAAHCSEAELIAEYKAGNLSEESLIQFYESLGMDRSDAQGCVMLLDMPANKP